MSAYKLPCGCIVERGKERVVEFCKPHGEQYREIHQRAVADHVHEKESAVA